MSDSAGPTRFLIIGGAEVRRLMPMKDCIRIVERAMRTVSIGGADLPLRIGARVPGTMNLIAAMPGYLREPESLGTKVIAIFPSNVQRGLSSHMGLVLLFDPVEGVPIALLDAASITLLRTAAATAVATRALARADAADMAVLGTGEQAAAHMHAICAVRELRSIRVWGRSQDKARELAKRESAALGMDITVCASIEEAVAGAGIVCTTTGARQPILLGQWIAPGTHVNLVGAGAADAREADEALVKKSRYFVDFRASALAQAGELHAAFGSGTPQAEQFIRGEIGEVLNETKQGRTSDEDVTVYKSLGIAAQDLAVSHAIYGLAREAGLGTWASI